MTEEERLKKLRSLRSNIDELLRWLSAAERATEYETYDASLIWENISNATSKAETSLGEWAEGLPLVDCVLDLSVVRNGIRELNSLRLGSNCEGGSQQARIRLLCIPGELCAQFARTAVIIREVEAKLDQSLRDTSDVLRAIHAGLFLEYVTRNPAKGSLRSYPAFREGVSFSYEGYEEFWTECEIFVYPENRWIIRSTFYHVESPFADTTYNEIMPAAAARRLIAAGIPLTLDELIALRELATSQAENPHQIKWDADSGELTIAGRIARRLSKPRQSPNIVRVYEEFQAKNWPPAIRIRFHPGETGNETLRETVRSLNARTVGIRFEADGTGEGIRYRVPEPREQAEDSEFPV